MQAEDGSSSSSSSSSSSLFKLGWKSSVMTTVF